MGKNKKEPRLNRDQNNPYSETSQMCDFMKLAKEAEVSGDWKSAAKYYAQGMEQRAIEIALIVSPLFPSTIPL